MATPMIAPQFSGLTLCISWNLSSAIPTIRLISSIIAGQSRWPVTFPRQGIGSMLLIKKSSRLDTNDFKSSVRRPCAPS
jgi:hypothetical protein